MLDRGRHAHARRREAGSRLRETQRQERERRGGHERRPAGEHLEEDRAERVDVAASIERGVVRLLRAHVGGRADQQSRLGEAGLGGDAHRASHAEIGDDRVAFLEEDVLRLHVAVDHLLAVSVVERVGHLARQPERLRRRQAALPVEQVAEGAAFDVGRDVIEEAAGLARVVERQQVGVLQARGDLDLAQEALGAELLADSRLKHLERDDAVVPEVVGAVDHRHPAMPDLPLDGIAGLEGGLEAVQQVEHGGRREGDAASDSLRSPPGKVRAPARSGRFRPPLVSAEGLPNSPIPAPSPVARLRGAAYPLP